MTRDPTTTMGPTLHHNFKSVLVPCFYRRILQIFLALGNHPDLLVIFWTTIVGFPKGLTRGFLKWILDDDKIAEYQPQ